MGPKNLAIIISKVAVSKGFFIVNEKMTELLFGPAESDHNNKVAFSVSSLP